MSSSNLSDSDILRLANDKNFAGSFSGVRTLQKMLYLEYHEKIPLQRLYNVMKKLPDYLMNLKPVRQFTRRHYQVYSFGELMEMDLGFMKPYKQFKYFLVVIDVFSWHMYARPLASKTASVVLKNLIEILDSIKSPITSLVSDLERRL